MNIDNLTLGDIKKLRGFFNSQGNSGEASLLDRYVGKYVICRSRNEGVNAGRVIAADNTGVILEDARRLYYHRPLNKNVSWYEGVAKSGLSDSSKVGEPVEKIIIEDYSLTVCNEVAEKSIREAKSHDQS